MSTFDKREKAFENKFAHDEELQFKIVARANMLLGLWAAEKLHKSIEAASNYASALVAKDVSAPGIQAQIHKDFVAAGVSQSQHQIARRFEEFRAQAAAEVTRK